VEEVAAAGVAIDLGRCREFHDQLAWMRAHKHTATKRLRLVGTDVPGSGGSPLPALEAVAYLRSADPDALPLAEQAIDVVRRYHDPATFTALGRYATLDPAALRMGRRLQRPTRGACDAQGQSCGRPEGGRPRCSNGLLNARIGSSGHGGS
jgi:erythromycin esterase-like protein